MSKKQTVQYLAHFALLLLSTATLAVIIWATWEIIHQPDLGVLWDEKGEVYYAKPESLVQVGDKVVTIDGIPTTASTFPYFNWQRDDEIVLGIARADEVIELVVDYSERSPLFILLLRLSVLVVAGAFWLAGTMMVLFLPRNKAAGQLFFVWCQLMALALALGNVTYLAWTAHLSIFFTFWIVPIAFHLHMLFPVRQIGSRWRFVIPLSYLLTLISVIELLAILNIYQFSERTESIYGLYFLGWVSLGLLAVILLLGKAYFSSPDPVVKQQVRFVAASGTVSLLPLFSLSILPDILYGKSAVPTELLFICLIGIPIGYSYAIRHYKFIKLEQHVSRATIKIVLASLTAVVYLAIVLLLEQLFSPTIIASPWFAFLFILGLIITHDPLKIRLQHAIDHLFYGGWYDYPTVIGEIAGSLEDSTNVQVLAETFCLGIRRTMRVHWSCLILPQPESEQLFFWVSGTPESTLPFVELNQEDLANISHQLKTYQRPLYGKQLLTNIGKNQLTAVETNALISNPERLWVPIKGKDFSLGILILSTKYGGDMFDEKDLEILNIVSRQVSIAFQKTQLIAELTQTALENEWYQKEIIRTREEERKRISRDLHDQIIQELVGLNYQAANLAHLAETDAQRIQELGADLQKTLSTLIHTTREICANLRPPALDLGLIPSIRSIVARFARTTNLNITLHINGNRDIVIPEDISVCLYQCTLESLSNIRKHALAHNVQIHLIVDPDQIQLTIQDDGQGFIVPERLGSLMKNNHFGLVGMRERLELMEGNFFINSQLQHGTCFQARIPLQA